MVEKNNIKEKKSNGTERISGNKSSNARICKEMAIRMNIIRRRIIVFFIVSSF